MTHHPCKGMTPACRRDFELIAINQPPRAPARTVPKLLAAKVIREEPPVRKSDILGWYSVPQWSVPLPIHAQWCQWATEQFERQGIEP